jgi:prohibitin 2
MNQGFKGCLIAFGVLAAFFVLFTIGTAFAVINPGERGILLQFGNIKTVYEPGLHFQTPVISEVIIMDVRTQKIQDVVDAASKDLQSIAGEVAVNYHVDPGKVGQIYQEVGIYFDERIISPAVQESVKAATAQYTAEELITQRALVKQSIFDSLSKRMNEYGIIIDDVSIVNFNFSPEFNMSIEAKQTAVQNALKAENDLKRIQIEAQQIIETAKADAESIRIQGEALRDNQDLVQLKMVEKWNGILPYYYMGENGTLPILNIQ